MQLDTTITLGQLLAVGVTLLLALVAAAWALLSLSAKLYSARMKDHFAATAKAITDQKAAMDAGLASQNSAMQTGITSLREQLTSHKTAIDTRLDGLASQTRALERDLLTLKGELPNHYERRDDAIRREVTIISRLERISEKFRERGAD